MVIKDDKPIEKTFSSNFDNCVKLFINIFLQDWEINDKELSAVWFIARKNGFSVKEFSLQANEDTNGGD